MVKYSHTRASSNTLCMALVQSFEFLKKSQSHVTKYFLQVQVKSTRVKSSQKSSCPSQVESHLVWVTSHLVQAKSQINDNHKNTNTFPFHIRSSCQQVGRRRPIIERDLMNRSRKVGASIHQNAGKIRDQLGTRLKIQLLKWSRMEYKYQWVTFSPTKNAGLLPAIANPWHDSLELPSNQLKHPNTCLGIFNKLPRDYCSNARHNCFAEDPGIWKSVCLNCTLLSCFEQCCQNTCMHHVF